MAEDYSVKLSLKDGREIVFLLEDNPRVFLDGDLFIMSAGDKEVQCSYSDVASTSFIKKVDTNIDEVSDNDIKIQISGNSLLIKGLGSGDIVSIYSISGSLAKSIRADSDGMVNVTLTESDMYIVSLKNETLKIKI